MTKSISEHQQAMDLIQAAKIAQKAGVFCLARTLMMQAQAILKQIEKPDIKK